MKGTHQTIESAGNRVRRRGVTLVELLVVILLVLILSALALQTLAPALKGRRVREGARQLEVFINRARNRAMLMNRVSGFQIDRLPELPEASAVVTLLDTPDPYTGDYDNSGAECYTVSIGGPTGHVPPGPTNSILLVRPCLITFPADVANRDLDTWVSPDPAIQTLVREGDQIQFEGSSAKYTMRSVTRSAFYAKSQTDLTTTAGGSSAPMWYLGESQMVLPERHDVNGYRKMDRGLGPISKDSSPTKAGYARRYKIHLQPVKALGGGMTLPEQVVIDLNYSGVAGVPFHVRKGDAASSYQGTPFCGDAFLPNDTEPITVMFNPDGTVASIKLRPLSSTAQTVAPKLIYPVSTTESPVSAPIFFLVGKRQRLPINPSYTSAAQLQNNWTDTECFWVSINPTSGLILTAENMQVLPEMNPSSLNRLVYMQSGNSAHLKDTSNMQDNNVGLMQGNNSASNFVPGYDAFDHVVYGARRAVIARLAVGGR